MQVFGGLGLFLFGLRLLSDTLQKTVGDSIKDVLGTMTRRPVYGLALGAIITGIIQSSSATTVKIKKKVGKVSITSVKRITRVSTDMKPSRTLP